MCIVENNKIKENYFNLLKSTETHMSKPLERKLVIEDTRTTAKTIVKDSRRRSPLLFVLSLR